MNMWLIIFKKELKDTLRDKRTLMTMIVVPLLIIPLMMKMMSGITVSHLSEAQEQKLRIALVAKDSVSDFKNLIQGKDDFELISNVTEDSVRSLIRSNKIDGAYVFSERFINQVKRNRAGRVKFYFRSSDDESIKKNRMTALMSEFEEQLLKQRFDDMGLDRRITKAVNLTTVDVATTQERAGKIIGGFLPYLFVIFCFLGGMYPAIDLAAGEKERGTMETLLTAPVSRFQILLGKYGIVVLTGTGSALISIVGFYVGFQSTGTMPDEFMSLLTNLMQPTTILLIFFQLLPLTMFFAGLQLSLSLYAKTFKEAQSLLTPFNIVVIVPAAAGLLPGVDLNFVTALVPVLNFSLATKEIMAGTINYALLAEVYLSLIFIGLGSLFLASKMFHQESIIFRS